MWIHREQMHKLMPRLHQDHHQDFLLIFQSLQRLWRSKRQDMVGVECHSPEMRSMFLHV